MSKRRKFLLASVLGVRNSSFIYPSCKKCFSRIIIVSKRSKCPKCGCAGKAENVSYRYKLSLKVAESNQLFDMTVFGSCLDTFFGLTATDLHKYIGDPGEISETLDSDTTKNLLTKAVETCFVGQNFIFGVTNFEDHGSDSSKYVQHCPDHKGEVKALVASQIVLPDPSVAGFTVIDFFHQLLQPFNLRKRHRGSQSSSYVLALGHSDSDLSGIYSSDSSSCLFESCSRDNFSRFWQPSLELTSIGSQLTDDDDDDDSSYSEQNKVIGALHQKRKCFSFTETSGYSSCHDCIPHSGRFTLYMDKKSKPEKVDEELDLRVNQLSVVSSSHLGIGVTDCSLLPLKMQEPLELSSSESLHSAGKIRNTCSQPKLTYYQHPSADMLVLQERPAYCLPSSLQLKEMADGSQDHDPEIWDDLPFSESLDQFLADMENGIPATHTDASRRKYSVGDATAKLHTNHSRLSVTAQANTGASSTPPVALRSSQTTFTANSKEKTFISDCEEKPGPNAHEESQAHSTAETGSVSANGRDRSGCVLSNASLSVLHLSSKDSEPAATRMQPWRAKISPQPSTSESNHSLLTVKCTDRKKSLAEMSEKMTTLYSRKFNDVSYLYNLENKLYYRWPENQDDSFQVCRQLTYSLEHFCTSSNTLEVRSTSTLKDNSPNTSLNTLREMPFGPLNNNPIQSHSPDNEGNYDASADLFDISAKEMDIPKEITKSSLWEMSVRKGYPAESHSSLRSLSEKSSPSSPKVALQSTSPSVSLRISSSPPHGQSDPDFDFEDSQDFVPYSQSTPVARFSTRIDGVKRAFEMLPAFHSDLETRISSKTDTQQVTSNGHKSETRSPNPILCGVTQSVIFEHCHNAEYLGTDIDEWVPPTTKKELPSCNLRLQKTGLRKCLIAHESPDPKWLPRKKLKHKEEKIGKYLHKKELHLKDKLTEIVTKPKTPKYNCKSLGWTSKESVTEAGSHSKVKDCLSFSKNCPSSVPETSSTWSPELFSQKGT
ncbi:DNA damage-induced apoptosis suppressor protein [Rhynchocyon petersi]